MHLSELESLSNGAAFFRHSNHYVHSAIVDDKTQHMPKSCIMYK